MSEPHEGRHRRTFWCPDDRSRWLSETPRVGRHRARFIN